MFGVVLTVSYSYNPFQIVYRAAGKEQKTKYTSILDTPDFNRAKRGQKLQSQVCTCTAAGMKELCNIF